MIFPSAGKLKKSQKVRASKKVNRQAKYFSPDKAVIG
jgi:hypothetical protein